MIRRPSDPLNQPADVLGADLLICADELATILKVSKRTLWRLLSGAKLPQPLHIGRSPRWRLTEINAWIAAGCPDRATWQFNPTQRPAG
ncbi:MAG: hypothetical protein K1X74_06165 [Pirellulales bacterium]|nr:hypothetical protein [Pirellulales bacterium]